MVEPRTQAHRRLYEIAEGQQGFFTTKQAKAAGFAENTHPYHVHARNWIREHRGIYRLALFPATDHPDLAQWALWSRNRREETEGVYSHDCTEPLGAFRCESVQAAHDGSQAF